jgi:NAD-dependent deacetylase
MFFEHRSASRLLAGARRVVVLTGAGISTDSGIPDYRGPQGLWTQNPKAEQMSSLSHYLRDPEVRELAWQSRLASPVWTAEPNAGHRSLVELERTGRLVTLVTQNVDGLHQRAGSDPELVVEVHGNMHRAVCWTCGWGAPMVEVLDRVRGGEADPRCPLDGGIIKSDTISFGQALVPEVIERALASAEACDLLLCVGSSLQVHPVANMVPRAKAAGVSIVIVNGQPTKADAYADHVLLGRIGDVLPDLLAP